MNFSVHYIPHKINGTENTNSQNSRRYVLAVIYKIGSEGDECTMNRCNDWMKLLFSTEVLEKYKNVHGLYDMVEGRYNNELSDVTK